MTARKKLMGINGICRDNVEYPLKLIEVKPGPSRPARNCFVYHYIDAIQLSELYLEKTM
jgi:hypothetical protein